MNQGKKPTASQELTDEETAQVSGGSGTAKPYKCVKCGWQAYASSPAKAQEAHAAESPGCGGEVTDNYRGRVHVPMPFM